MILQFMWDVLPFVPWTRRGVCRCPLLRRPPSPIRCVPFSSYFRKPTQPPQQFTEGQIGPLSVLQSATRCAVRAFPFRHARPGQGPASNGQAPQLLRGRLPRAAPRVPIAPEGTAASAIALRLSALPPIREGSSEGQEVEAETAVHPLQCAARPLGPVTSSSNSLYPSQGEAPHPMVFAAPTTPLWSQQLQDSVLAAAAASEYHRQLQEAMQHEAVVAAAATMARVRQLKLFTVASGPAGYETKWEELHPASQRLLLRIEGKLEQYKYQSQLLDQCSCLHDPSCYNKSFERKVNQVMQEVGSTSAIMDRAKVSIKCLTDAVKQMMWKIDIALQSYVKLRPRFVQGGAGGAAGLVNRPGFSGGYTKFNQRLTKAPNFYCYSGSPRRPSLFIQHTVARYEEQIGECFKRAEELEQLVQMKNDKSSPESLESLSKVISNMHDYFIHVASKLEDIHQAVEAMKTQYLNARKCGVDWNDPFVEADTRESAKQEAADRMIRPTLHLSSPSQPKTPITASVKASQLQQNSFPMGGTFPSSCPALSLSLLLPTSSTQ